MRRIPSALLLAAAIALATASAAGAMPGKRHGHHRFDPAGFVAHHAERLGLDEATLESIETIVAESRGEADALRDRLREARGRLRELLAAEPPDEAAVMAQAAAIGAVETELDQLRLRTLLRIRELLTPEQRAELERIREEGPFARFRAAREACAEDVARLCPDAPAEGPHALLCLKHRRDEVGDACRAALEALPKRRHHHRWGDESRSD